MDGGADLSLGGMCSYYHDLIYLAAIVQLASVFTDRIWWSFLLVCNQLSFMQSSGASVPQKLRGMKSFMVSPGLSSKGSAMRTCHAGACIRAVPALGVSAAALCICTQAKGNLLAVYYGLFNMS